MLIGPTDLMSNGGSDAKSVNFVPGESGCVGERLADIFLVELRQFLDELHRGHAVGNEVDNVGHRDAKTADRRPAGENIRVLRNPIESVCHD